MKKTFFSILLTSYIALIFILSTFTVLFSFNSIKKLHLEMQEQNLKNISLSLKSQVVSYLEKGNLEELDRYIKKVGSEIKTRITVIDLTGKVFADSDDYPATMDNHFDRTEISQALKDGFGSSLRFSRTLKEEMLYVAVPISIDDKPVGIIRSSLYINKFNLFLREFRKSILLISTILVTISVILAFLFAGNLSSPINQLSCADSRVSSGECSRRVFLHKNHVLNDFSEGVNSRSTQLKTSFDNVSKQAEELNHLLESIPAAIALIDSSGEITLLNSKFKEVMQIFHENQKTPFWKIIRNAELIDIIEKVSQSGQGQTREIIHSKLSYLCTVAISDNKEIIISMMDNTEIMNVRKIKRDFVVNVSHELRTPLTAMKGFIETMEDELLPEQKNYMSIVKKHTERLVFIVNDLLTLSSLENEEVPLIKENFLLSDLLDNVYKVFKEKIHLKGLDFTLESDSSIIINGDQFRIEQVFINLVDNAIKYTEKGSIYIKSWVSEGKVQICVKDTGIGIPEEHLDRIFERFYVVDKSRSRKAGGTGLGLSIVKHIIELHKGTITVTCPESGGTEFVISLTI